MTTSTFLWTVIVLLIIIYSLVVFFKRFREVNLRYRHLPSPPRLPVIGSLHLFLGKELFNALFTLIRDYGPTVCVSGLSNTFVLLSNPEDIQKVLTSAHCLEKADIYDLLPMAKTILVEKAHVWKPNRRFLSPTMGTTVVNKFIPIFNKISNHLVAHFESELKAQELDCLPLISKMTLTSAIETILDDVMDPEDVQNIYDELKCIQFVIECVSRVVPLHYLFQQLLKRIPFRVHILGRKMGKYARSVLLKCQQSRNKKSLFCTRVTELTMTNNSHDFDAVNSIGLMLGAATQAPSIAISNTVLLLAMHPDIQEKCYEEMRLTGVKDKKDIDVDFLLQLEYLECIWQESLRLLPVIPFIGRKIECDLELVQYQIPSGTNVFISIANVHRSKSIWGAHADEFNPDHFLPDNTKKRPPLAFIPFSYGTRNCIASKYVVIMCKIMLVHLIRNYKFRTSLKLNELKFKFSITNGLDNKHLVQVRRRLNKS